METLKNQKVTIGTAVIALVAIIGFVGSYNDRMKDCESSIKHLKAKTAIYNDRYENSLLKQQELEVSLAEIKVKLVNIETILTEIKEK